MLAGLWLAIGCNVQLYGGDARGGRKSFQVVDKAVSIQMNLDGKIHCAGLLYILPGIY
jgi:hypothetical protein